jgi:hypothetical protein
MSKTWNKKRGNPWIIRVFDPYVSVLSIVEKGEYEGY